MTGYENTPFSELLRRWYAAYTRDPEGQRDMSGKVSLDAVEAELDRRFPVIKSAIDGGASISIHTAAQHVWEDGPDGKSYHCQRCGISKCFDHDAFLTCVLWLEERRRRGFPRPAPDHVDLVMAHEGCDQAQLAIGEILDILEKRLADRLSRYQTPPGSYSRGYDDALIHIIDELRGMK